MRSLHLLAFQASVFANSDNNHGKDNLNLESPSYISSSAIVGRFFRSTAHSLHICSPGSRGGIFFGVPQPTWLDPKWLRA